MSIYCPNCGAENRETANFCLRCSVPLKSDLICASCGAKNPDSAKYCLNCAMPLRASTPAAGLTGVLPANSLLAGRYLIVQRIGKGGMGAVYLVADTRIGGKVWAIKEMSDGAILDPAEKQRAREAFQREAQLLAKLDHPNLPKVSDFFIEGGKLYLVMDYIDGQTLEDLLDANSAPLPEARVLEWAGQLCDVLNYLHQRTPPIIFRDLKPGNIMIDAQGRVKLIDFGVARLFRVGKQRDTENFGTAGYAPPEQYGKDQTDARSDIYALGVTLHQLLTHHDPTLNPFKLPPARKVNPAVSVQVEQALLIATQPTAAYRYQSVVEFKTALISGLQPPARPVAATTTPPVFLPTPIIPPSTSRPAVAPIVPAALPTTAATLTTKTYVLIVAVIGSVAGLLFAQIAGPSQAGGLAASGFGFSLCFMAGPFAYTLFRRPGSFLLAWLTACLAAWLFAPPPSPNFSWVVSSPISYVSPIVFELLAALRRHQLDSSRSMILATLLAVLAGYLVGRLFPGESNPIFFVSRSDVLGTLIILGGASALAGFAGDWLGRLLRERVGWA